MQVTPIVAIAPLLLIYLTPGVAVLVCAFLVAFFPLLANTTLGLSSADHNLVDLFQMYRASRMQQFMLLRLPSALPYFLAGLRISGGLALIGAIVAEIAAGSAGQGSGLAYRIVESGFRLNIPRMFAALLLISIAGITIHLLLTALSHWLLRDWHESERRGGNPENKKDIRPYNFRRPRRRCARALRPVRQALAPTTKGAKPHEYRVPQPRAPRSAAGLRSSQARDRQSGEHGKVRHRRGSRSARAPPGRSGANLRRRLGR